jgi:hypothetical protein
LFFFRAFSSLHIDLRLFSLKFRPIAIIVSSVYVTWIYRTFYSHYHIQISKELTVKCRALYENFRDLRQKRPNVFCGFITSILFLLAVIGHVVNGTYILLGNLLIAFLKLFFLTLLYYFTSYSLSYRRRFHNIEIWN